VPGPRGRGGDVVSAVRSEGEAAAPKSKYVSRLEWSALGPTLVLACMSADMWLARSMLEARGCTFTATRHGNAIIEDADGNVIAVCRRRGEGFKGDRVVKK
jgi:hypothetical protein